VEGRGPQSISSRPPYSLRGVFHRIGGVVVGFVYGGAFFQPIYYIVFIKIRRNLTKMDESIETLQVFTKYDEI
jgi:hypothetical protein